MTTLTGFLLARIAEDEAAARTALEAENGFVATYHGDTAAEYALGLAESEGADRRVTEHYARHDPARVLADCEAHRSIVEMTRLLDDPQSAVDIWLGPGYRELAPPPQVQALTSVIKALAAVYADHPDYRPEWRP